LVNQAKTYENGLWLEFLEWKDLLKSNDLNIMISTDRRT